MAYEPDYSESEPTRAEIDKTPGALVIEFGAPWCGYCQAVQAVLKELMAKYPQVQHIKIHDGRGQPLGRSFRVKLWPNLVFMLDGQVLRQMARPTEAEIAAGLRAISEPEA